LLYAIQISRRIVRYQDHMDRQTKSQKRVVTIFVYY